MLLVQQVINVVTAFAQKNSFSDKLADSCNTRYLHCQRHSVPCGTKCLTDANLVHLHFEHTELVYMLLGYATDSVVHRVNVGAA